MDKNVAGHRNRLKEKYLKSGYDSFHSYEKIELILTYGIPRKDVKSIAKALDKKFGSVEQILSASKEQLLEIEGIGESTVAFLKLLKDIGEDLFTTELAQKDVTTIDGTKSLINFLRSNIGFLEKESFKILYLDNQNKLIGEETLSEGTIDKSTVYPREVVEKVLNIKAKSIILAHNHPGGSIKPSVADINITMKLKNVLDILEIRLLDHIIITRDSYYSFLEEEVITLGG